MGEYRMPSLGADMDEGRIVEWKVRPGDRVHRGDVVAVVETDKADIDAEVFEDGVVGEILVPAGERVPVGTPLATIVTEEAPGPAPTAPGPAAPVRSPVLRRLAARAGVDLAAVHGTGLGGTITRADLEAAARHRTPAARTASRTRAAPRARRLAAQRGIDVASIPGTGPQGAVTVTDVEAASQPRAEPRAMSMQQRIASLMERANREIPHYWVTRDLDFGASAEWLATKNGSLPPAERLVAAAVLLAATARAAATVPDFNGIWADGAFRPAGGVDLGLVVVLREGGLLVPVIHDAAHASVTEIMARMADLVRRARAGRLRASEISQPTITVSNLGDQGADEVLPVIYPPQVALVGFGRVRERPWAEHGLLGVRPVVTASVAGDHRVSDGHRASRFLAQLDRWLQSPDSLDEVWS